ncbi:DUF4491 family protein [Brucepastera parasyntrophica]|uniref:DUF4491 family protein n=1 Tax=Brucepastera parasyntrophica TaxID=2880008 RepID=UPI00210A5914|nr:DUF4491 family protein [Brucepastera parasyntrophica]ULQ59622.1 DUF4491 family protein [Brucepastera parasyntrophica]
MNWDGIITGFGTFLIIGIFHPIVIKTEYHFGKKAWPLFLAGGIICCAVSVVVKQNIVSCLTAVTGFTMFWSIHELIEQEERVKKGWYPAKPAEETSGMDILEPESGEEDVS